MTIKNKTTNLKIKAITYCRVSSKEQEETGYSLDAQEKLLKEYASSENFNTVKTYRISESASGRQIRTIFNDMVEYATKHKIPTILCEKIDRLTRNLKDASIIDDWVKEDPRREVHFVKEAFILNQNTKAHENLVWDMKVAIARFYANNLSEEVKKGQKEKIAQGWLPTKPPLGYKTIGEKGHKTHIIDKNIAPHVCKLFELYATGNYSISRLEDELHKMGLRSIYRNRITRSRIHELLSDPFYYGKNRWKGIVTQGKHEPLISKDLFDKVQNILKRKIQNPHYRKHSPIFKGRIYCESCNGLVTWYEKKGHWYGHCNNHGKSKNCPNKTYIRQDRVNDQLVGYFEKIAPRNKKILDWIEQVIKKEHGKEVNEREIEIKRLNGLLKQVRIQKDKYFEAKINKEVPVEYCERKIAECIKEEEVLESALAKRSDKHDEYQQLHIIIHELAYKSNEIYEKALPDEKQLLLSQIFTNLIQDGHKIKPKFTLAAQYLQEWMPKLNKDYELLESGLDKRQRDVITPLSPTMLPG